MDRNDNFLFSLNLSRSHPVLGQNKAIIMFFYFVAFFCYFFGIPYSGSCWNGSEREYFFFSHSQPVPSYLGLIRSHNNGFNFLNFFAIFLEFPITGPVGMVLNENFLFLSFSASPVSFWLGKKP